MNIFLQKLSILFMNQSVFSHYKVLFNKFLIFPFDFCCFCCRFAF
nr:MAG TPA: hypothetical protein [Caudoviricetes sp.]